MILRSLTDFVAFTGPIQFVKCRQFIMKLNSYGLHPGSKRERRIRRPMFSDSLIIHKENTKEINVY